MATSTYRHRPHHKNHQSGAKLHNKLTQTTPPLSSLHNDWTNNKTNPLQQLYITSTITIPSHSFQYTPPPTFPLYYIAIEPLLTSIRHISHTCFLQNFLNSLLNVSTTYPIPPSQTTPSRNMKIPKSWHNAIPPPQTTINQTSPLSSSPTTTHQHSFTKISPHPISLHMWIIYTPE
jgi:hypothetical protein